MQVNLLKLLPTNCPNRHVAIKKKRESHDGPLGLAGWMYADLFLAMMVVFLATITFTTKPTAVPVINPAAKRPQAPTAGYYRSLKLTYTSFNPSKILSDISQFEKEEGIPQDSMVVYANVVSGYTSGLETTDQGFLRAVQFVSKLQTLQSPIFNQMASNYSTDPHVSANEIVVTFTFGPNAIPTSVGSPSP